MKTTAVRIHAAGGPDVLRLEEIDLPEPAAGEVRIRHTAIGLNFQDIYTRSGRYPAPMPTGLGTEAVGVVEAVGEGVADFKTGDRVCYISGPLLGACATHRNYAVARLLHAPAGLSDETLAASMLKGMTVEYLLTRCYPVQAGQFVLMHAAAGGVGLLAGQWGRHLGAKMIGVAAGPEKVRLALANGYAHCIDRLSGDIAGQVREITGGKGVPVVLLTSVGKDSFDASLNSLAPRGFFVSFGTTTGAPPPVEAGTLQKSRLAVLHAAHARDLHRVGRRPACVRGRPVLDAGERGLARLGEPALSHEGHRARPRRPGKRAHHRIERDPSLSGADMPAD